MSNKQQRRIDILIRLDAGTLESARAAELLGISARHLRRVIANFRQEGMQTVVHGNTNRAPANRTDPTIRQHILELTGPEGKYRDFNVCHLKDMLAQEEAIIIGRSTLDRLLRHRVVLKKGSAGKIMHRRRRPRYHAEGMLLQWDGSPFEWLRDRGPKMTLLGAIDDATGKIVALLFRPTEDQIGYLLLLRTIALTYGLPMAIYHDRHTILRSPKQPTLDDELAGTTPMSQIQRLLAELGIESIPAYSPQAKGRVERLWGTLQDRLVKEMALAGIATIEDANSFLPGFIARYNTRFAKTPADPESAWVPLPEDFDIAYHFSVRESRGVRSDNCIQWQGRLLQLQPGPKDSILVRKKISVHVTPEGALHVYHERRQLPYLPVADVPRQCAKTVSPAPVVDRRHPRATAAQRAWLFGHR